MEQQIKDFLTNRNLNPELVTGQYKLSQGEMYGKQGILIPFIRKGEIVNRKLRSWDKQFYQDKDATKCFWNEDVIYDTNLQDEPLIITEGEFDAMSFIQGGFSRSVSVPDGAPNETHDEETAKYDYLQDIVVDIRKHCPYVILAADNDTNGNNLIHDLALRLGRDFCKWVKYPKGCKDANDSLIKYGNKVIGKIIETQEWLEIDGVFTSNELPPVAEAKIYNTHISGFENNFKLRLGDFSIVTGIPGMGKSTFVNDVMCRMAHYHGLKTCFASFEQHPSLDHIRNLRKWAKFTYKHDQTKINKFIQDKFCFVYPTDRQQMEETIDIDWFLEKASAAIIQHSAKIIVIDPWNELEHKLGRKESMTEYVGRSIKRLKHFAKSNNVHLMVVAHPAKMYRDKNGNFPMPSLYDISDSAHWANKADIGIVVHRESYESTETIIANKKSRYHEIIGFPAAVKFRFNREINRFECAET